MPFVDINSITPKVQPVSTTPVATSSTNDTNNDLREIKGPPLAAENIANEQPVMQKAVVDKMMETTPVQVQSVNEVPATEEVKEPPVAIIEPVETAKVETPAPEQHTAQPISAGDEMEFAIGINKNPSVISSTPPVDPVPVAQPAVVVAPKVETKQPAIDLTSVVAENVNMVVSPPIAAVVEAPKSVVPPPVVSVPPVIPTPAPRVEPQPLNSPLNDIASLQKHVPVVDVTSTLVTPEISGKIYSLIDYLNMGVEMGASDLHFTVGYRVQSRVNGVLSSIPSRVLTAEDAEKFAMELFAYKGVKDSTGVNDLDMSYELPGKARFRVNVYRQLGTYAMVFRLIPATLMTVDQLNLPNILLDLANLSYGLILVTGPTGSGKSTTLSAIINYINQNTAKHIVTVEDPIEYVYPKGKSIVDQREVGQDTDSWHIALRSVLRQDPNVVLVGEMRDYETIASAITIAETGHLVFATLHTNSAAQTIDRIVDVFPEAQQPQIRVQLANTLQAVVAQRLVPESNGKSRRPAVEILMATDAVRSSIRDNKTYQIDNIIQTGADVGMVTLERSLVNMIKAGIITTERAQEFTNKPDEIVALLSRT